MDSISEKLHRQIIRMCKGILKAWEEWLDARNEAS